MSSKSKVDTIENVAGSGNVSLGSGHNLVVPGNTTVTGSVITSTGFSVGNTAVLGQEIDVSSGDFTLDVAGDITLDADGGQINLNDGGTNVGKIILNSNQDLLISSRVSDKDVVFSGNDGGSMTEFMRIDSSLGGVITTPGRPAFLAYGSPSVDSLSGSYGHIHSFGNADGSGYSYDVGNNYTNSTGRFTAPVAGKYYFHGSIYRGQDYTGGAQQMLGFSKNNDNTINLLGTNAVGNQYEQITITGVFHLAANDYVNFVIYNASGSFSIQGSEPRNYFLGYQIS